MTREEIRDKLAVQLLPKYGQRFQDDGVWAWGEIRTIAQSSSTEDKMEIIRELANSCVVREHLKSLAKAEADAMLTNDSLDLTELARVLG